MVDDQRVLNFSLSVRGVSPEGDFSQCDFQGVRKAGMSPGRSAVSDTVDVVAAAQAFIRSRFFSMISD
ncbi:hypothetical protein [Loktanella sp. M215]|uniref:hypothetical protein n=1 Tax=Loktanella sp. M215 TaxID=2675431 RepID=UPI001F3A2023|nr:hypothetical protein [Loktanella sp. M215]MCF7701910.1 hypothetical protein [Loktanella sp. M215]